MRYLVLALGVLLSSACRMPFKPDITHRVTVGESRCRVVGFPDVDKYGGKWESSEYHARTFYLDDWAYFALRNGNSKEGYVLIAAANTELRDVYYSKQKYWLKINGNALLYPATETEWKDAAPLLSSHELVRSIYTASRGSREEQYSDAISQVHELFQEGRLVGSEFRGKRFTTSGQTGVGVLGEFSSNLAYLLLRTYTEIGSHTDAGREPEDSRYYVDVFRTDTGQRVIGLEGTLLNILPSHALKAAAIVDNRFFISPLRDDLGAILFCKLDESVARTQ